MALISFSFAYCSRVSKILVPICTKFGQLILRKIIKIIATRCQILRPKCTKFVFGWGSAPDPAGELTALHKVPLAGFKGAASRLGGGRGRDGKMEGRGMGREGDGRREERERGGREEKERKWTEGMRGTGEDMGWDGERREMERRKGGKGEMGYSPQTSIPGAATANEKTIFITFIKLPSAVKSLES